MSPIEAAVYGSLIVGGYAFYKAITLKWATEARGRMTHIVHHVVDNDEYSQEFKELSIILFQASLSSTVMIKAVFFSLVMKRRGCLKLTKTDKEAFPKVVSEFVKVNMLAAPHWYAVMGVLFFISVFTLTFVTLGLKTGYGIVASFERALTHPYIKHC